MDGQVRLGLDPRGVFRGRRLAACACPLPGDEENFVLVLM